MAENADSPPVTNRFGRMEVAGAFGDLGTLVPFVVAYIGVLKMDPFGVLFAFGLAMIVCGFVYRTPVPVQPMKAAGAIATTQAAQTLVLTPAMVCGASLATGLVWLLLGLTGTARYVAHLVARPIVLGIILGLGFAFMIDGAKMMAINWWIGGTSLFVTALLLTNRVIHAMFLLLLFGAAYGILSDPTLFSALRAMQIEPRLPTFALAGIFFNDFFIGFLFLALPQVPLTLGNAIIAITEENNRLFPHRPVNESKMSTSTLVTATGLAIAQMTPGEHSIHGRMGDMMSSNDGKGPMQDHHRMMMMHKGVNGMGPHGMMAAGQPMMPGQGAFGTIQEIVAILEADPSTDWSKVNIAALREHLIDMNEVTLKAVASERRLDDGLEIAVTRDGRTREAIKRMVPAHARELSKAGWTAATEELPNGVKFIVTSSDPQQALKIKGLGFMGLMVQGAHHQLHHLAMAKGEFGMH